MSGVSTTAGGGRLFEYSARDRSGRLVTGRLDAADRASLVRRLQTTGQTPVSVREVTGPRRALSGRRFSLDLRQVALGRVSRPEVAMMSRQLATMLGAGLPVVRALTVLQAQTDDGRLRTAVAQVRDGVTAGTALSAGLGDHPGVFPAIMVSMCRAGEVGGFLDRALLQVADVLEAEVALRAKVRSALAYPAAVLAMAAVAAVAMLLLVVPVFEGIFADLGGELPAPTRFLIWLSHALGYLLPLTGVLAVVGGVCWRRVRGDERVRAVVDPLTLRVPVFGPLLTKVALSRFTRDLGTLVSCGVPVLRSLEVVEETSGNLVLARAARHVREAVSRGSSMAQPLAELPVFPAMVVQMLAVGEETGTVDTMLAKVTGFYDQQVQAATDALTSLLEPLLVGVLGVVVGGMVIALYLPVFSVFDLLQ